MGFTAAIQAFFTSLGEGFKAFTRSKEVQSETQILKDRRKSDKKMQALIDLLQAIFAYLNGEKIKIGLKTHVAPKNVAESVLDDKVFEYFKREFRKII